VIGTGEYVLQHERNIIEQTTGARFVNEYGCTEAGLIGFECEQRSLHVMSSNIYLEIIKDGKNVVDEEGDIYVTELNTRTNPFIRYELGDRGILCSERCPCGRALPVIKVLFGRKNDYVITPEGNKIYAAIFSYILKEGVDKFKVIQSNINSIDIYIVVNDKYSHSRQNIYHQALQRRLSDSIRIDFHIVKSIKHENSGKLKYFERTFQQC
jgi:phenylacetate-CoA ligase